MATSRYAESTDVPSDRSIAEIQATLRRYGADRFGYFWEARQAVVMFDLQGRRIRFCVPLPNPNDRRFTHTAARRLERTKEAREAEYEQAVRQRWRALALVIKAKLEAVTAEITTVEEEFLAHIVLPSGATVGEWFRPQLAVAYEREEMPALMPGMHS
jgi:hypothetical protein